MGNRTGLRRMSVLLLLVGCFNAHAFEIFVFGPVESVSIGRGEITVLGTTYKIDATTRFGGFPTTDSRSQLRLLSTSMHDQQVLVISNGRAANGPIALEVYRSDSRYVPGASEVVIRGVVESNDVLRGELSICGTRVYVGGVSDLAGRNIQTGSELLIVGKQAVPKGTVWAENILPRQRVTGTGFLSTTEADAQGITATGALNIAGTGAQSITGTGAQSITGTGALSITGTGAQSITGTGLLSITGTGLL